MAKEINISLGEVVSKASQRFRTKEASLGSDGFTRYYSYMDAARDELAELKNRGVTAWELLGSLVKQTSATPGDLTEFATLGDGSAGKEGPWDEFFMSLAGDIVLFDLEKDHELVAEDERREHAYRSFMEMPWSSGLIQ